jgi:hypothetical protein
VVERVAHHPQPAQARGLEVHHPRREGPRLDVVDRVDRRVPGDPVVVGREDLRGLRVLHVRVLEPGVREPVDHATVERRVGGLVHDRARVEALEVQRVHGARGRELGDQRVVP